MKEYKVLNISLGCEKNLVDSEMIVGAFYKAKFIITTNIDEADIIIVNTCGFIDSAKEEAINTIVDVLEFKENGAKIIVTGCLVQRYQQELMKLLPEVDLWVPIRDYYRFGELLSDLLKDDYSNLCIRMEDRILSTPPYMAYVRISDGCNNRCNYCAIPLIRGNFVSRREDEIVSEIEKLVKNGVIEINLISQDLTNYGYDLRQNGENVTLVTLLKKLVKIDGIKWIRMLYLYPDEITDELIELVSKEKNILPYFDIPIQHASDKMLKLMNRRGTNSEIKELVEKIRNKIPDAILRTTLIVGFPHETNEDFEFLKEYIKDVPFEHLGAFAYSREEDTKGYSMSNQVSKKIKNQRLSEILDTQKWVSLSKNREMIGKEYDCIIERYDEETNKFYGRTYAFAPDDIDGSVIIDFSEDIIIGDINRVYVYDADFYDLFAKIVE